MAYFDDDKAMLEARVKKLGSGYSWSEDPPSRTRHHITNVRVLETEGDELTTEANFSELRIARRHVFLDHTVIQSRNLSNFF